MITALEVTIRPLFGSVKPTRSKSQKSPLASPTPRTRPTSEARMPTTSASIRIEVRICRREAPIVRAVANSRVRCAIVIESEFAITKLPTKSAIPPKASRKPRRNEMKEFVSAASSFACCVAVFTCAVGGTFCWSSSTSWSSETPGFAATAISSSRPRFAEQVLRRRQAEARERGAADRRDRAEVDEAGDSEPLRRTLRLHADRLAELEVLLVRRGLVDDDVAAAGPGALHERERVEAGVAVGDAEAEVRRAAVDDRLAVVADQLRLTVDAALGRLDVGQTADLRQERLVEGRCARARAFREVERRLAADHGVGALADVVEDRVERLVDRVGQHERPHDHGDAEHDRERGQHGAELPSQQTLEREADHPLDGTDARRIAERFPR